jgi:hypothetical protein
MIDTIMTVVMAGVAVIVWTAALLGVLILVALIRETLGC